MVEQSPQILASEDKVTTTFMSPVFSYLTLCVITYYFTFVSGFSRF